MRFSTPGSGDAVDQVVRAYLYGELARGAPAPSVAQTAGTAGVPAAAVAAAYRRLAAAHTVVLRPGTLDILYAAPFAAVVTAYRVEAGGVTHHAPCAWDALGIPAALGLDAAVRTNCEDCGEELSVNITDATVSGTADVVHFLVPARHWWDDIEHT